MYPLEKNRDARKLKLQYVYRTSLCARTNIRNVGWGGHISTLGVTLPEVWARSVQYVARGKPFKLFWPWARKRQNPRVSATPPGMVNPHSLSPCTHIIFGCKPGFSAGLYAHVSLFLYRAPRYDSAAQQQSSPLAAAVCNSMHVWLLL